MIFKHITPGGSKVFTVERELIFIGSGSEADIQLSENDMPEAICKLEQGTLSVLEKGFKVLHNGIPFESVKLVEGDKIEIGSQILVYESTDKTGGNGVGEEVDESSLEDTLYELATVLGTEKDIGKTLENILAKAVSFLKATEGIIYTLTDDAKVEKAVTHGSSNSDLVFSDTIVQKVLSSGKGVVIPSLLDTPEYSGAKSIADLNLHSIICSPIKLSGELIGLLYLGTRDVQVAYSDIDLKKCGVFSAIAGMIIYNVNYITRQQDVIKKLNSTILRGGMIAGSPAMTKLLDQVDPIAPTEISVLILGETGTGKDVLANYIHDTSPLKDKPFIPVNCSSLRDELLESELFGYKKGAFTGAISDRKGLFQAADGGTLFLDEIGEMNMGLQAKLLRVLETGKIRSVGDVKEIKVNVRILTATNKKLQELITKSEFREDLYFRLAQITVELPPLRERAEDILHLAYFFFEQFKGKYPHKKLLDFSEDTKKAIVGHEWPGNIREMYNTIHRSFLTTKGPLMEMSETGFTQSFTSLDDATRRFQKNYIERALLLNQKNKEETAKVLGMSRSTFFRYLSQLEIE